MQDSVQVHIKEAKNDTNHNKHTGGGVEDVEDGIDENKDNKDNKDNNQINMDQDIKVPIYNDISNNEECHPYQTLIMNDSKWYNEKRVEEDTILSADEKSERVKSDYYRVETEDMDMYNELKEKYELYTTEEKIK